MLRADTKVGPKHMPTVQWPPVESEQHEIEQVQVLQKHIPAKKMEYQWPPPPPVYQGGFLGRVGKKMGKPVNGEILSRSWFVNRIF
ncbi:unnamed protein product [Strongylus vulgaris]|uniref:Uncharacterized protein n=1 Tax=Strongylus vulgaris TaxID=40348 RepID=A0A3P7J763_STRVU|nr:unnamed protein product [Strongylus vulgaris]